MAAPITPVGTSVAPLLDPDCSSRATHGGSSPPPSIDSPVPFRRQMAFIDENMELCPEITGSSPVIGEGNGDLMGGAGPTSSGTDSTPEEAGEHLEGEDSDQSDGDGICVLLGSDSDSDVDKDPKERVQVRMGWINQEYRDLKSYNDSFQVETTDWETYLHSRMVECGYIYQNETWVKAGPPTQDNIVRRAEAKAKAMQLKPKSHRLPKVRKDRSKIVKKPAKKPAAKSMKKIVLAMKAMKIASSPRATPPKSSSSKSKGGKGTLGSPSPMKSSPSSSWKSHPKTPKTPMKAVRKMAKSPETPKRAKKNSKMMASTPIEKNKAPRTLRRFESSPVTPKNLTK